jgi:hypothetical protein
MEILKNILYAVYFIAGQLLPVADLHQFVAVEGCDPISDKLIEIVDVSPCRCCILE